MSNETLESLSADPRFLDKGVVPWFCWESENSSFGKCFREWTGFPRFLPLCVVSPHGAQTGTKILPNEVDGRAQVYFGWRVEVVKKRESDFGLPSYLVPHPWVSYRRRHYGNISDSGSGVLYFFPHSNQNYVPEFDDLALLRRELRSLQENLGPVSICLSFHDISKGTHLSLRDWGFPIVTAGHTASTKFVDRFYELISRFRYTASSEVGSQSYYSIEAGVPHFLTKSRRRLVGTGINGPAGRVAEWGDYFYEQHLPEFIEFRESLFSVGTEPTSLQRQYVEKALGLGAGISAAQARRLLWRELVRNSTTLFPLLLARLRRKIASGKEK